MDVVIVLGLGILGVIFLGGLLTGSITRSRENSANAVLPEAKIVHWFATHNVLCLSNKPDANSCATVLSLLIDIPTGEEIEPFDFIIQSRLLNEGPDSSDWVNVPKEGSVNRPWVHSFYGNDTRLFYSGAGMYSVKASLVRNGVSFESRSLTIHLTESSAPLDINNLKVIGRQFMNRVEKTVRLSDMNDGKATLRTCKNMALLQLRLTNTKILPPGPAYPNDLSTEQLEAWQRAQFDYSFDSDSTANMSVEIKSDGAVAWEGELAYGSTILFGPPTTDNSNSIPSVTERPLVIGNDMTITVTTSFQNLSAPATSWVSTDIIPTIGCPELISSIRPVS